jgi:hypothetical protein
LATHHAECDCPFCVEKAYNAAGVCDDLAGVRWAINLAQNLVSNELLLTREQRRALLIEIAGEKAEPAAAIDAGDVASEPDTAKPIRFREFL